VADIEWDPETASVKGANFLDEVDPGWQDKINKDTLNLRSSYNCVLGQLSEEFHKGMKQHGLSYEDCWRLGFLIVSPSLEEQTLRSVYFRLTWAWRRRIAERQPEPTPA